MRSFSNSFVIFFYQVALGGLFAVAATPFNELDRAFYKSTGAVLFERRDLAAKAGAADGKTVTLLGIGSTRTLARLRERGRAVFRPGRLPARPARREQWNGR